MQIISLETQINKTQDTYDSFVNTLSVLYCTIFCGKRFFHQVFVDLNLCLKNIWYVAYSGVFDWTEGAACQNL